MARLHLIYLDIDTGYYPGVHHGLAGLAAAIRHQGHVLSFHHLTSPESPDAVVQQARSQSPDIIGFSFTSTQKKYAARYAEALHKAMGVLQIAGGVHPSIAPEEVLQMGVFSGVAVGEAEASLPELLSRLDQGEDPAAVPGFWWLGVAGEVKQNPIPPLTANLADLPLPDYSIFETTGIGAASAGWIALLLSRGCPYNCSYCCNHVLRDLYPNKKNYVRLPPVEHAIKLVENGRNFYPEVRGINFADDLLIFNKTWFAEFAQEYKKNIGLPYTCNGRVEHFSDEIIDLLKQSGCVTVHIGVESGSEWLRQHILNRHPSNQQIADCFTRLRNAGIATFSYNIVGFPFETKQHMEETLALNRRIQPDMGNVFYFFPFPGTKLYRLCQEYELLLDGSLDSSGYLEAPSIRALHCTGADCRRVYQKIRLYLASRALVNSFHLPAGVGTLIYWLMNAFPAFFVKLMTKRSALKAKVRKWLFKRTFANHRAFTSYETNQPELQKR